MATGDAGASEAPSLIAASAAVAALALSMVTVAGLPSDEPWRLPHLAATRLLPPSSTRQPGPSWSPAVPPPR